MNTKLLASIAVFVLLAAVVSISMTDSAFADEKKKSEMMAKKDTKKTEMKEKKDAKKTAVKEKKETKKAEIKATKETKKAEIKEKKETKKAEIKEKKAATGSAASEVSVEMAKGTASKQDCADKCYMPSTVNVSVGGKVTWKNVDSAAHTATATDSSFDTSLVNAGASSSNTFNTAGTYPYMCILHPWMKGTVNVQ